MTRRAAARYRTWHTSVLEAARLLRRIFPEADLSALLGMEPPIAGEG